MSYIVHRTCAKCLMKFTQRGGIPGAQLCPNCSKPKRKKP